MISASIKKSQTKKELSEQRIQDVQKKIQDESYIDGAIQRIAQVLSYKLIENKLVSRK